MQNQILADINKIKNFRINLSIIVIATFALCACAVKMQSPPSATLNQFIKESGFKAYQLDDAKSGYNNNNVDYVVSKKILVDQVHFNAHIMLLFVATENILDGKWLHDCEAFSLQNCVGIDAVEAKLHAKMMSGLASLIRKIMLSDDNAPVKQAEEIVLDVYLNVKTMKSVPGFQMDNAVSASIQYKKVNTVKPMRVARFSFAVTKNRHLMLDWALLEESTIIASLIQQYTAWDTLRISE